MVLTENLICFIIGVAVGASVLHLGKKTASVKGAEKEKSRALKEMENFFSYDGTEQSDTDDF